MQDKQQQDMMAASKAKISENLNVLTSKDRPSIGDADADVTVVEFFDYNCGYCKKAVEDIKKIHGEDKKVRFVFFEMPVLGMPSLTAAQWSHAAHNQGKYFEYHTALLEHNGGIDEKVLEDLAKKVGLDVEKLKKDVMDENTMKSITSAITLAQTIGIQGTPGFVVNGELYPGYIGEDGMRAAIAKARGK